MPQSKNEQDKKVLSVVQELSQLLIGYKYDEAWGKAGELSGLLRNTESLTLPSYMLDMLKQHLKSYYYQQEQVNKSHKAQLAIGHKLEDFQ
ncbi:hypothetical protein AB6P01_09785 [Streptococcus mutans]|uniref:hypothetical protein n=1 Tax=Streptococcus mutans TaxID=1309 RepID=UPI0038BB4019